MVRGRLKFRNKSVLSTKSCKQTFLQLDQNSFCKLPYYLKLSCMPHLKNSHTVIFSIPRKSNLNPFKNTTQKLLQTEVHKYRFVIHLDNSNSCYAVKKKYLISCVHQRINFHCIWHNTWDPLIQHTELCFNLTVIVFSC